MEIKSKARLRKILRKGEQLSTNRRLLEEEEKPLCGNPCDQQKRSLKPHRKPFSIAPNVECGIMFLYECSLYNTRGLFASHRMRHQGRTAYCRPY